MFVKFDNKIYWVKTSYVLTQPSTTSKKRKRIYETIYILHDCEIEEIAVKAEECESLSGTLSYSIEDELNEFLERKLANRYKENCYETVYLKCSYETNPKKEYYIESIDKILEDGMIVNLRNGDIRHFKFDKLYIACGDGVIEE